MAQIESGDVPGTRAPADPEKAKARVVNYLKSLSKEDLAAMVREVRAA